MKAPVTERSSASPGVLTAHSSRLEKVVGGFARHTDIAKVKEVAAEVSKLQEELNEAEEKRATFNKREAIFGLEQVKERRRRADARPRACEQWLEASRGSPTRLCS